MLSSGTYGLSYLIRIALISAPLIRMMAWVTSPFRFLMKMTCASLPLRKNSASDSGNSSAGGRP